MNVKQLRFRCAGATTACRKAQDGPASGSCPFCGATSMAAHLPVFVLLDVVREPCTDEECVRNKGYVL